MLNQAEIVCGQNAIMLIKKRVRLDALEIRYIYIYRDI